MKNITVNNATVPALGFGTFQLESDVAFKLVQAALAEGFSHIDTAQMYKNEEAVGRAIKTSDKNRDQVFLTTKVWRDSLGKNDFLPSVEESLRKLQTDHVDLLLIHWPNQDIALEETVEQLVKAKEKGYTSHIGVSNFPIKLVEETLALGADIITNQVEYHPFINQQKLYQFLRQKGLSLTAYSPIAQGKVLGNELLKSIGDKYGKNEIQVTLRWMMQQDGVIAIPRSSKEANMKSNLAVFDFELSQEDVAQIDTIQEQNKRLINPPFAPTWD